MLNFRGLANQFYYRLTPDGFYWNGTGCGNEVQSENPGTRRLILDSLKYWVAEYRIDGFRFDLAAGIDKETLLQAKRELPNTIMISEPWTADWNRALWRKGDLRGSGWSNWNDDYKHAIRDLCKSKVDKNKVKTVMAGSCFWWAENPQETVNFLECHDNATFDDFLGHDEANSQSTHSESLQTSNSLDSGSGCLLTPSPNYSLFAVTTTGSVSFFFNLSRAIRIALNSSRELKTIPGNSGQLNAISDLYRILDHGSC